MSFCKHQSNHCIDVHHPCLNKYIRNNTTPWKSGGGIILDPLCMVTGQPENLQWIKIMMPSFLSRTGEITFSVIGKFGTSEIEGIDEEKRKSTSGTSGENVGSKFLPLWSSFWCGEDGLDLVLEGKVQCLCWEVSDAVSKIS